MLNAVHHELGHAFFLIENGLTLAKFEIEYDATGEFFGDSTPEVAQADRSVSVKSLYAGPLAEVRSNGSGRKIDKQRSLQNLLNLPDSESVPIYFEGLDEPITFHKGVFGTDWNNVAKQARDAQNENPELDIAAAVEECLEVAIDYINDDAIWAGVTSVANKLMDREELKSLQMGDVIDLRDEATILIREALETGNQQ